MADFMRDHTYTLKRFGLVVGVALTVMVIAVLLSLRSLMAPTSVSSSTSTVSSQTTFTATADKPEFESESPTVPIGVTVPALPPPAKPSARFSTALPLVASVAAASTSTPTCIPPPLCGPRDKCTPPPTWREPCARPPFDGLVSFGGEVRVPDSPNGDVYWLWLKAGEPSARGCEKREVGVGDEAWKQMLRACNAKIGEPLFRRQRFK